MTYEPVSAPREFRLNVRAGGRGGGGDKALSPYAECTDVLRVPRVQA